MLPQATILLLYLAPILGFAGVLLSLFAYLATVIMFPGRLPLLIVTPSDGNGTSIFIGSLGSCTRARANALACTGASFSPIYDLRAFPSNAPLNVLSRPPSALPAFLAISVACSFVFFVTFTLLSFRQLLGGNTANVVNQPFFHRINTWIGFSGWFIGLASFLALRLWFGKAAQDFNAAIQTSRNVLGGQLVARDGNGFILAWFAYGFLFVPVMLSLVK
ncbi:hypothetical protein L218DRAFT_866340, partial [Marasmius fiardii PR-910]